MKTKDPRFPSKVEVQPQHVGEIGEILFTSMSSPPEPIPDILSEVCRDKVPDWLIVDEEHIQTIRDPDTHFYSIEKEDETLRWENDAKVNLWYSGQHIDYQDVEGRMSERWSVECPVEIKTGDFATTRNDQREVMEYLAKNTEYQPFVVRLNIDSLPASFSVTGLEIIEG